MNPQPKCLGIIAGNRSLPLLLAREARKSGVEKLVAVAFDGETSPELASLVDEIVWLKVGQLSKMIETFKTRDVTQCVMVGQIAPKNLFNLRPDFRAVSMLFKLKEKNAHSIFGAIADELARDGIVLIEAVSWLQPHIPQAGFRLGPSLSREQEADVQFGFRIAKEISRLEIGQSVVVKDGTVLSVEAFEGTDRCLSRGGELSGSKGGAIAVKVAKLKHDLRFDIPCVGPSTIETCAQAKISVLAIEGGRTLLLDEAGVGALTRKHKISLVATDH
jgi:DUF1009 family protein